jgi:hypothetical protein
VYPSDGVHCTVRRVNNDTGTLSSVFPFDMQYLPSGRLSGGEKSNKVALERKSMEI